MAMTMTITRQTQGQIHLDSTLKERPQRLVTIDTFDQSDEETLPDQQKDNDRDKDNEKHPQRTILDTCDL